jgi:hypothetical protein
MTSPGRFETVFLRPGSDGVKTGLGDFHLFFGSAAAEGGDEKSAFDFGDLSASPPICGQSFLTSADFRQTTCGECAYFSQSIPPGSFWNRLFQKCKNGAASLWNKPFQKPILPQRPTRAPQFLNSLFENRPPVGHPLRRPRLSRSRPLASSSARKKMT